MPEGIGYPNETAVGPTAPVNAAPSPVMPQAPPLGGGATNQGDGSNFPASRDELRARFSSLTPAEKDIIGTAITPEVGAVLCKILGGGCDDLVGKQVLAVPGQPRSKANFAAPPAAAPVSAAPPAGGLRTIPPVGGPAATGGVLDSVVAR